MEIPGYEIERCIGQGGMASAYLARQTSLDRKVVLKILDTSITGSQVTIERFLNEGRIVASLHHPHIITTYDIGQAGTDVFISMEFVDGGDLKQRLKREPMQPAEVVDLIAKIGSSLAAAHAKGIVHRDVKPGNILFRADGTPLLSDFGIAKRLTGDADLTSTGMFVGSPNYMAPEQSDTGPVDGRADIYALGVIFYEMLTGRKPYPSESVIDIILKHKKDPVPELPPGLEEYQELLNLMMAKDRNDRFRDAKSLIHYIDQLRARMPGVSVDPLPGAAGSDETVTFDQVSAASVRRVTLEDEPGKGRLRALLAGIALLCAVAYGVLMLVERRMKSVEVPRVAPLSTTIERIETESPPGAPAIGDANPVEREKVTGALTWLGTHSLNEYRLTAPPQDNAYYYFARLLQMDPDSETARQGLAEISARYALLTEREIAEGNYERARSYVSIGLQVDPSNEALLVLRDLAVPGESGFFDSLLNVFR
ncbi:MAG: serine/threonine-protein kinase [Gammaproteobacteria bacterium]|jgi:serine/threonine-protein kinase PpkA